jgi:hypothetical protein
MPQEKSFVAHGKSIFQKQNAFSIAENPLSVTKQVKTGDKNPLSDGKIRHP